MKPAIILFLTSVTILLPRQTLRASDGPHVAVNILENIPDKRTWDLKKAKVTKTYTEPAFGFLSVPTKYSSKAHALDRSTPFVVRGTTTVEWPAGEYRLLLRSRSASRLYLDGKLILEHKFVKVSQNGHNPVKPIPPAGAKGLPQLTPGQRDVVKTIQFDGKQHAFRFEVMVGSRKTRPEIGVAVVAVAKGNEPFRLLSPQPSIPYSIDGWRRYVADNRKSHFKRDALTRERVSKDEFAYWNKRHVIAQKVAEKYPAPKPPKSPFVSAIDRFIGAKQEQAKVQPNPLTDDMTFLRRVSLDITGVVPSRQMILTFMNDKKPQKRARLIAGLLHQAGWADHWVSFWQDILAENPGLIKPTLNNTGPFRFWLHQAMSDNLPMDRFVTELIMMEGSVKQGAPAAFGLATKNDVPMAAKSHVLAKAFLGVDMTCARCHDAPYHPYKQKQLFGIAAMLQRKPLSIPKTSSVPIIPGERTPGVEVSLQVGSKVSAEWLFPKLSPNKLPDGLLRNTKDSRARVAAMITSPHNRRFAKVLVNRVWQRYMGVGLVKKVDDWHGEKASHPELLDYLAQELITHHYDLKYIAQLILNSQTYQRIAQDKATLEKNQLFAGPAKRRMTAEQLVDSLFAAVGKEFDSEELTFDPECWQKAVNCPNLGKPRRAWEFVSLSNERDRPALALPIAQGYVDLLNAFGWRATRPAPQGTRDETLTPLQVMTLANGQLMNRLIRLTDDCEITSLCMEQQSLQELVQQVYQRSMSRSPSAKELATAVELLENGYKKRLTGKEAAAQPKRARPAGWSCHLRPEATRIQLAAEQAARAGDPATVRLDADWRMRMEDFVWSLLNSPEFVFVP